MRVHQQELIPPGTAIAIPQEQPVVAQAPHVESHPLKYTMGELRQIAETFYASGMFRDVKSMQGCMTKILAGSEMGYGPFQSMRAFHLIENKPVETSGEISARIKRSPIHDYRHWFLNGKRDKWDPIKGDIKDLFGCVVVVRLKKTGEWEDQEPVVFTMDDASAAGLATKTNWKNYKRAMLFARTITEAARAHCADLFGGPIYTAEELGASVTFDKEGNEILEALPAPVVSPDAKVFEKPDPSVDNEKTRASGQQSVVRYASNRKIPDAHRHEIAQAMFGKPSTKELTTPELRDLYALLVTYVKSRDDVTHDGAAEWDEEAFHYWLELQVREAKAAS